MPARFTDTNKWADTWFSNLKQIEMLLFLYICDNCDIAGFIEINHKRWAFDLNSSTGTIEEALKGLERGIVISKDGEYLYLRNFLKHQKNLPINPSNPSHRGILKRFQVNSERFDIEDVEEFIKRTSKGALKGLQSLIGKGIGKGKGKGKGNNEEKGGVGEKETDPKKLEFERFNGWVDKTIPYLRNIRDQITYEQYCNLTERYNGEQVRKILIDLANYKDAPKKYVSVNLTFQKWAKKEYNG